MFDRIAVPTDGSEGAERAAGHARAFARTFGATVHVVSVADERRRATTDSAETTDSAATTPATDGEGTDRRDRLEREARAAIAAAADLLGDGVAVETDLLHGRPHEAILGYVADRDVDLVVMGTHGRTDLRRALVGGTTERVVRLSERPVLTVGPDADPADGYGTVLIPTDGSDGVEPAVDCGLAVAAAFGATVHALYVADVRSFVADEEADVEAPDAALDLLEDRGEDAVRSVVERAGDRGLDAAGDVVDGVPSRAIVDAAADRDADLVVLGTRGRTGLDRLLLGSVAEKVLRRVDCPALTVRRSDDEE
ncbi:universal stress protein [Halorussus sp. AFM4]|uniref:universal stress protein n=1 Tax=Halorussus sp. AFM4 TaxID=3421651 RepID=UPI003EBBF0F8